MREGMFGAVRESTRGLRPSRYARVSAASNIFLRRLRSVWYPPQSLMTRIARAVGYAAVLVVTLALHAVAAQVTWVFDASSNANQPLVPDVHGQFTYESTSPDADPGSFFHGEYPLTSLTLTLPGGEVFSASGGQFIVNTGPVYAVFASSGPTSVQLTFDFEYGALPPDLQAALYPDLLPPFAIAFDQLDPNPGPDAIFPYNTAFTLSRSGTAVGDGLVLRVTAPEPLGLVWLALALGVSLGLSRHELAGRSSSA